MDVEHEHIQELIANGHARVVDVEYSRKFGVFLNSMPWNIAGTGLSWKDVPHITFDLSVESTESIGDRVGGSAVGRHNFVLVMFSPKDPGLICSLEFALANVDTLYWRSPGRRYMCGVEVEPDAIIPSFEDLIEFDGNQYLKLRV